MVLAKHTELDSQNVPEFRLSPGVLALRSHCPGELGIRFRCSLQPAIAVDGRA
jgi:hypothetical protein